VGAAGGVSKLARNIRAPGGRPISDDEALVAFNALCDLGVLEKDGSRYILNKERFAATEELRGGVQAAVEILRENRTANTSDVQLCVSLPPSLSPAAEHVIHESSTDLRSSLLDLVASAKRSLDCCFSLLGRRYNCGDGRPCAQEAGLRSPRFGPRPIFSGTSD
jgi:hypothetical protein